MDYARLARDLRELLDLYNKGCAESLSLEEGRRFSELCAIVAAAFRESGWKPPRRPVNIFRRSHTGIERFSLLHVPHRPAHGGDLGTLVRDENWLQQMETLYQQALSREREQTEQAHEAIQSPLAPSTEEQSPQVRRRELARALVNQARQDEAAMEAARQPRVAQEAQRRAAIAAWEQFRDFRDQGPEEEMARNLARRVCLFGRYLRPMGLTDRLEAISEDPNTGEARRLAALTLLAAADRDVKQVAEIIEGMAAALWTVGLEARHHLCEVLPRELLGIEPEPERPCGWEGSFLHHPVTTPDELIRWLEQAEGFESIITTPERLYSTADTRVLRDAYRLVDAVGVVRVPPQPAGTLTVEELIAALGNLRRAVREEALQINPRIAEPAGITPAPLPEATPPVAESGEGDSVNYEELACRLRDLLLLHAAHCPGELSGAAYEQFEALAVAVTATLRETRSPLPFPERFTPDDNCPEVAYLTPLNVPYTPLKDHLQETGQNIFLLPCAAWRGALATLAERADNRHGVRWYRRNPRASGYPLVFERVIRDHGVACMNLEQNRKLVAGFTPDWFLPVELAERWQTWTFPAEQSTKSISQWRSLQERAVNYNLCEGREAGQRHLAELENDLGLLREYGISPEGNRTDNAEGEQQDTGETDAPKESYRPTGRAADILRVMLEGNFTDKEHTLSQAKITNRIDPDLGATALDKQFRMLRRYGLIDTTQAGCLAGTYLSPDGIEAAREVLHPDE
jgi:hypothetical protein